MLLLEIGDGERPPHAALVLDVVREDHGRAVAVGPEPAEASLATVLHEQQAEGVEAQQPRDAEIDGQAGKSGRPCQRMIIRLPAIWAARGKEPFGAIEEVELLRREPAVGTVARPCLAHIAAIGVVEVERERDDSGLAHRRSP